MRRRDFLQTAFSAAAISLAPCTLLAAPRHRPVIDTHIHLFDPSRPGGVPWPERSDTALYRPALPERYAALSAPFGVVGAIAIEASPLPADSDWLLRVARSSPLIVGVIGDLVPGSPNFARDLDRLRKDELFLGIRYGNLWGRSLAKDMKGPGFLDGLRLLSDAGLVLDSANPDAVLVHALAEVAERLPALTIAIDHLPGMPHPGDSAERADVHESLGRLSAAPRVSIKLSQIPEKRTGATAQHQPSYREKLDVLWDLFGEDRVMFGSDWPNSDHVLPFRETTAILEQYARGKSGVAQEKLFWRNSVKAYKWRRRTADQPAP